MFKPWASCAFCMLTLHDNDCSTVSEKAMELIGAQNHTVPNMMVPLDHHPVSLEAAAAAAAAAALPTEQQLAAKEQQQQLQKQLQMEVMVCAQLFFSSLL